VTGPGPGPGPGPDEGRVDGRLLLDHDLGAESSSVDWLPGIEGVGVGLSAWDVPTLRAVDVPGAVRWTWSGTRIGVVACSQRPPPAGRRGRDGPRAVVGDGRDLGRR
jgi:hypothetical protein